MNPGRAFSRMAVGLALLVSGGMAHAYDWKQELEAGHQGAYRFRDSEISRNRFYLFAKEELSFDLNRKGREPSTLTLNGAVRAWTGKDAEVDPRALSAAWSYRKVKLEVGFQEIPWGETFGIFIADLVNPRDLRDPLFNEMSWVRLPVFAVNGQVFLGKLTLQGVFTPIPRNNQLGDSLPDGSLRVGNLPSFDAHGIGPDSEYGGRASYLFESGVDLGLFYYRHWNRNVAFAPAIDTQGVYLAPLRSRVHSVGLTASEAVGVFVFRADSVFNQGEPGLSTDWQTIVGADFSWGGDLTAGLQLHDQRWTLENDGGSASNQWISFMLQKKFLDDRLITEAFVFGGLDNPDLWFQPKVTWNLGALGLSLRADLVGASAVTTEGMLPLVRREDRVMSGISYRF